MLFFDSKLKSHFAHYLVFKSEVGFVIVRVSWNEESQPATLRLGKGVVSQMMQHRSLIHMWCSSGICFWALQQGQSGHCTGQSKKGSTAWVSLKRTGSSQRCLGGRAAGEPAWKLLCKLELEPVLPELSRARSF